MLQSAMSLESCAHDLELETSKPPALLGVYLSRDRIFAGVIKLIMLSSFCQLDTN